MKDVVENSPKMMGNTGDPNLSELVCAQTKSLFRRGDEDVLETVMLMLCMRPLSAGQQSQFCEATQDGC